MLIVLTTVFLIIFSMLTMFLGSSLKKNESLEIFGFIATIITTIALMVEGSLILSSARIFNKKTEIYYKNKYEAIQRVLSLEKAADTDIVKEIYEYNTKILVNRYYIESLWYNWFANETIANQPLIDFKDG